MYNQVCGNVAPIAPEDGLCCDSVQLETLSTSLHAAKALLSSCPACMNNLLSFFCLMTCSPNQSQFTNVSQTVVSPKTQKPVVTNLTVWLNSEFGAGWFSSCEGVKFPADNRPVMDLIGGGARNWSDMVQFLGKERLGGSPFTIHFPTTSPKRDTGILPLNEPAKRCYGDSLEERCSCVDCNAVCPVLDPILDDGFRRHKERCRFLGVTCLAWLLLVCYFAIVFAIVLLLRLRRRPVSGHLSALQGYLGYRPLSAHTSGTRSRNSTYSASGEPPVALTDEDARLMAPIPTGFGQPSPRLPPSGIPGYSGSAAAAAVEAHAYLRLNARRRQRFDEKLQNFFRQLGVYCAFNPGKVIAASAILVGTVSILGWPAFKVERDPVNLWVASDSRALREKNEFEAAFGPFYRTEQIILSRRNGASVRNDTTSTTVVTFDNLKLLFDIENIVRSLRVSDPKNEDIKYGLEDLCFKPTGDDCVIQSVSGYFSHNFANVHPGTWRKELAECAKRPVLCLPPFKQPIRPDLVFGGIENERDNDGTIKSSDEVDYISAKALITTFVLKNSLDPDVVAKAKRWETALIENLKQLSVDSGVNSIAIPSDLRLSFSTEISVEEELNQSSNTDVNTIVISYMLMFLYVSLALGRLHRAFASSTPGLRLLVETRFLLGLGGIVIVLAAVSFSVAFFSFFGYKTTLIIAEVIPFLVLAIGVDNVFILVGEFDRQTKIAVEREGEGVVSVEERCGATLARMGPSILISAVTEVFAFSLGAVVGMPAVSAFAAYSAIAVAIDALLQITCFVSFMALDAKRQENNLADIFPCIRLPPDDSMEWEQEPAIVRFFRTVYSHIVLHKSTKPFIILAFLGWFLLSLLLATRINLGLG